jgi:hypothetical protein
MCTLGNDIKRDVTCDGWMDVKNIEANCDTGETSNGGSNQYIAGETNKEEVSLSSVRSLSPLLLKFACILSPPLPLLSILHATDV